MKTMTWQTLRRRIKSFEDACADNAFVGSYPPDEREELESIYRETKREFIELIKNIHSKAREMDHHGNS